MNQLTTTSKYPEAKPIKIFNENNKLSLKHFIQIHFAPPCVADEGWKGPIIGKIFFIEFEGTIVFAKLIDYEVMPFWDIASVYTLLDSGIDAYQWKFNFMTKYPQTTNKTRMAVYAYEKLD